MTEREGAGVSEELVYRISTMEEWELMQKTGSTFGGDLDRTTGFIHLRHSAHRGDKTADRDTEPSNNISFNNLLCKLVYMDSAKQHPVPDPPCVFFCLILSSTTLTSSDLIPTHAISSEHMFEPAYTINVTQISCKGMWQTSQVQSTLLNFFLNVKDDLYLLQIDAKKLGNGLVYEAVGDSNVFPHFYGPSRSFSPLPLDTGCVETKSLQ
uniref:Uncharacterized protein n=1 Tax=Solanum lycopersicum TaxID=4081 RepID=A0A3Q7H5J9_SOLLC